MILNEHLTEQQIRLEKVKKLREMGIEPWPEVTFSNSNSEQIKSEYISDLEKEYSISGRIMTIRAHGKTTFATLKDSKGKIQIYIKLDTVGENKFNLFSNFVDTGDILWCIGKSFKTKTGEVTLLVNDFHIASKCISPMPEKFYGLTDIETKYRQRYLDLIVNEESKNRLITRSKIVSFIRNYLENKDYTEVETPMLHPIAGGAAAKPFVTHHKTLDMKLYLRIAPELYLKRLVVGGLERVFEINRNFRNEGISTRHNPEFTMLEFYTANQDYNFSMDLVEDLLRSAAKQILQKTKIEYGTHTIDFEKPFTRISMSDSVKKAKGSVDLNTLVEDFEKYVEPNLIQPTFITGYPISISPLSRKDPKDPSVAARYELFIGGMEISNGYNELNNPQDQASRFESQIVEKNAGNDEAHEYDEDFIKALEYALPPTSGVGIGIDRLTMLITNTTSIKDVIAFPTLKEQKL